MADPAIEFIYQKNNNESISLACNLGISINREIRPLKNSVIHFYTGNDFEISLGCAVTNKKEHLFVTFQKTSYCLSIRKENIPLKSNFPETTRPTAVKNNCNIKI